MSDNDEPKAVVDQLRKKILCRGFSDLTSFGVAFRQFDKDQNHEINLEEFRVGIRKYGIPMAAEEEGALFNKFDIDK